MKHYNLIINTHWDREYRWSFAETQYRLVEAVDDLIDIMEKDKGFAYFHTDSQVSMLDDYIQARPERKEEVKKLVREGRILTGPWYTLPAEFLVNGEALVRNITLGHKIANDLGKVMKAAYNIFSWGQVSQLPQIYRQFGMDTIIFYRGINPTELNHLEFKWKGADGKEAMGITFGAYHRLNFWSYVYLPYILGNEKTKDWTPITRETLSNAYLTHMCGNDLMEVNHWLNNQEPARDLEAAQKGLKDLIATVESKSSTDELLFLQGFDQENPDPIVTELVDRLNSELTDAHIDIVSLEDYIKNVKKQMTPDKMDKLETLEGEMLAIEKTGDAFGPLYNGVFSARMPIKLANTASEYTLINGAEPVAVYNMMLGKAYPYVILNNAWKELLQNQQHDGIGGCHVDRVSEAMLERYRIAKESAETVIKSALRNITGNIDFSYLGEKEIGLVLSNTLSYKRDAVVTCTVDVPLEWKLRYNGKGRREISLIVADEAGNVVPSQFLSDEEDTIYSYMKFGNVFSFDASRCRIAVEAKNIPANGYLSLRAVPKAYGTRCVDPISKLDNIMENKYLKAEIMPNGTIELTEKATGRVFRKLHYFEDCSDKGGPLGFSPTYEEMKLTSLSNKAEVALVYNGPLLATYSIIQRWKLPKKVETELKIHVPHGSEWVDQGRIKRSKDYEEIEIQTMVTLKKDSHALEFNTIVDNKVKDHRLRVLFPTGMKDVMEVRADEPFDVVKRKITVPDSTGWYEAAAKTWPSHSFAAVEDNELCVQVAQKGIPEYEVTDNEERTVALTLLRCFSNAGNPTEVHYYQPLSECQGKHAFQYSIVITKAHTSDAQLVKQAMNQVIPVYPVQTTPHKGNLDRTLSFLEVDSEDFIVSAVKQSTDGENGIILRGYNLSDKDISFNIKTFAGIGSAYKQTLEGNKIEELKTDDHLVKDIHAGKREIVTVFMKLQ